MHYLANLMSRSTAWSKVVKVSIGIGIPLLVSQHLLEVGNFSWQSFDFSWQSLVLYSAILWAYTVGELR